jgi:hypothetical protein
MAEVGRPTELTEDTLLKIKEGVLNGLMLKEIANICGIAEQTIYDWTCKNYKDINTKIEGWKRDRKVMLADKNVEGILCLGVSDDKNIKVVADMSKFVLEVLDKNYKPKQDITSDNKPLPLLGGQSNGISNNPSNEEVAKTE